jgi:predicted O-methyltransferase YrrM
MGRETKSFQEIMSAQFDGRKPHQVIKGDSLYHLAGYVPDGGNIVELGTFRGMGTAALCLGAKPTVRVHTVDDFKERTGWAGEHYDYGNYAYFKRNMDALGLKPVLINGAVEYAKTVLDIPIDLVFFDLGLPCVVAVFDAWQGNVVSGGMFAVHDTPAGYLGAKLLTDIIEHTGKYPQWRFMDLMPGDITVFQCKK